MIQSDVVTNVVDWDGNPNTWNPPSDALMLIQSDTETLVWELNSDKTNYVLVEILGQGQIGFTWNGMVLTTNQTKPVVPAQPTTTGTQAA